MKRLILIILINVIGLMIFAGCVSAIRYDGPYEGRVIDADTREPIEGAVVLGVWHREIITPGGATHNFYDAEETLTDENGEFKIPGLGLKVFSNITPMSVLIFKVGYEHIGMGPWRSLKKDILLRKKIKWEGNKAIIPIKKWTLEERRNRFGSYYIVGVPDVKQKLLLKEIDKENKEIGK